LKNLSEFLPFIFKFDAVPVGLKQLYVKSDVSFPRDFDWAHDWTSASEHLSATILKELPIFKLALAFRAYADYGLLLEGNDDFHGIGDLMSGMLQFFPRQWGLDEEMDRTITAAVGRWKLDYAHEGLTPDELAALARVSRKSVMNLIAPGKSGTLQKDSDDKITIESARRWLLARPDFRPSIMQPASSLPKSESSSIVEPLFVPVAGDGSWFSPGDRHQRDQNYYVGNGNDERKFDDYWTALDFLARAASPRWRYADTTGRWRIKTATGWERKARQDVQELLSGSVQHDRQ
jgi:hypothetical protein